MDVTRALESALPGVTVSASSPDRVAYSRDLWPRRLLDARAGRPAVSPPLAVVWPTTTEQLAALARFARAEGFDLVPFGAGRGVCGGVDPGERTIVVDVKKMRDFSIDPAGPSLDVGAGAMGITLEEDIQRAGHTIGHFPSSILCSTVGGWIAARGAGQCSGKYGKIEDMVLSVDCVLGTGDVVTLKRRFDGPNMVPLVVGSEGTLCTIARAKLRLHPVPAARAYAAFSFPDTESGWDAFRQMFQAGLRPAVSRLYDPIDSAIMKSGSVKSGKKRHGPKTASGTVSRLARGLLGVPRALNAVIQAAEGNLLGGATMVLVFEGASEEAHADCEQATRIAALAGARPLGEGPARKWFAHRYSVSYRQAPVFRLGAFSDTMEVAAPWSKLSGLYDGVRAALGDHVLVMAHLSHAYPDGCSIYFTFSGSADSDAAAIAKYEAAWRAAMTAAVGAGGTLSHHHGVGRSKAPRLGDELGFGVELVRRLMRAWDPDGLMNRGNLVPPADAPLVETRAAEPFVPGRVDEHSLLATFSGDTRVDVAEATLRARGLTLGAQGESTVATWVAEGMPGAKSPWADPVAQALSGFVATLSTGRELVVRPAPRRAVGPDLSALVLGARERIARIDHATFAVQRRDAPHARELPFGADPNPPMSDAERAAWERIVSALR
ncbi:MAG: FAD-binding oxidoreductase [Polyangiaceae bacterium]|nr:FAD-binding oxidoreductase [Polyangiaceae bacterium]